MLLFGSDRYRRLLGVAILPGPAGGVFGLVHIGGTEKWWWILLIAADGIEVAVLRQMWHVPENVPGGVVIIESGDVDHTTAPRRAAIAAVSA